MILACTAGCGDPRESVGWVDYLPEPGFCKATRSFVPDPRTWYPTADEGTTATMGSADLRSARRMGEQVVFVRQRTGDTIAVVELRREPPGWRAAHVDVGPVGCRPMTDEFDTYGPAGPYTPSP